MSEPGLRGRLTEGPWEGRKLGRKREVRPGQTVSVQRAKLVDGDPPRPVRLVLRAKDHTLYYTVTSGIDDETIIQYVNVPKNSARAVLCTMTGYNVDATHPDLQSTQAAEAHFRQDEVAGQSSLQWSKLDPITATGAEVELVIPPFAMRMQLLSQVGLVGTLRFYKFDRMVVKNRIATIPIVGAYSDVLPVNDAGITTFQGTLNDVWSVQFQLEG